MGLLFDSVLGFLLVVDWGVSLLFLLSWATAWLSWSSLLGHGLLNVAGAGSSLARKLHTLSSLGSAVSWA